MNKLDHVVTDNINTNKNQHNVAIENDPNFDNKLVRLAGLMNPNSSKLQPQRSKYTERNDGFRINMPVG